MEIFTLETAVLAAVLSVIALVLAGTVWTGVPPMPTSDQARGAMLRMTADLAPARIYELGAGWGGLAVALARQFPDATVTAVEISPLPWAVCRLRRALFGPANLEIRYGNALKTGVNDGDLIACFLCPGQMTPLEPKLEAELKPGAFVVSNTFALPGWTPVREERLNDLHRTPVYLYRNPG